MLEKNLESSEKNRVGPVSIQTLDSRKLLPFTLAVKMKVLA